MVLSKKSVAEAMEKAEGLQKKAAKILGVSRYALRRFVNKNTIAFKKAKEDSEPNHVKTLADFRSQYDNDFIIPTRIKAALKILGTGWQSELDFAKDAKISITSLRDYRPQFDDYVVEIPRDKKRVWTGNKKTAKQMREML